MNCAHYTNNSLAKIEISTHDDAGTLYELVLSLPAVPRQGDRICTSHEGRMMVLLVEQITWMEIPEDIGSVAADSCISVECSLVTHGPALNDTRDESEVTR